MGDFLEIAFSFPTVVFTVSSIVLLGFWMVTTVIGAGVDAFEDLDLDADVDTDVDADLEVDARVDQVAGRQGGGQQGSGEHGAGDPGVLGAIMQFLAIGRLPLLIALNLDAILAWLASVILMAIIGQRAGWLGAAIGLVVLVAALVAGTAATRAFARRFAHVFTPTRALRRRELIGSLCMITTSRVTAEFGQAEVFDPQGGSLLVQVRCTKANDLVAGDRALIFDVDDDGRFQISPDPGLAL